MLGAKKYPKEYINACRKKVKEDAEAFRKIASANALSENVFFNNMVIVLETMFVHRVRGQEGKDGNPLNEVRMICNSILTNKNRLLADNTIKYTDNKSVLKIKLGGNIALTATDFMELSNAFFAEIEKKFS